MKPSTFEYARPKTVAEAVQILAQADGEGRVLAGGQTLGPMLNMRLAMPRLIVDIGHIAELRRIERNDGTLVAGATVTHATFEDWDDASRLGRLLANSGGSIAYRAVRNRGTIGGSLCHADSAADWVTTMTLVNARIVIAGRNGSRRLPMTDFMLGTFSTALDVGEMLESVEIPQLSSEARWGYYRICRKVGEFPEALGAVLLDPPRGVSRVIAGAMDGKPVSLPALADQIARSGSVMDLGAIEEALDQVAPDLEGIDRQLHAVAVRRAMVKALA